jgi:peptidyl-prolyl cis-trans isomerase A (cyclophilin A)
MMKRASILFFMVCLTMHASAALLAHVGTDKGMITVELRPDIAPQAVANFITLAQGTRASLDPTTGRVVNKTFYSGEKFFRVVNDAGFKIIQTGSGTGTNSGGPGFTFKDEFSSSLLHEPYVLSMANSGPNSNGSQIFFTGNTPTAGLDYVHTVFGQVIEPASRAVIDAILAAGDNGSEITSVTIERTDAAAEAFDEFDQGLPYFLPNPAGFELVNPTTLRFRLKTPLTTGMVFHAHRSNDLTTWQDDGKLDRLIGLDGAPQSQIDFTTTAKTREFFHPSVAVHPGAVGPDRLATELIRLAVGSRVLDFQFNATGNVGSVFLSDQNFNLLESSFFLIYNAAPSFDPHSTTFFAITGLTTAPFQELLVKAGWDGFQPTFIFGHHALSIPHPDPGESGYVPIAYGDCLITR